MARHIECVSCALQFRGIRIASGHGIELNAHPGPRAAEIRFEVIVDRRAAAFWDVQEGDTRRRLAYKPLQLELEPQPGAPQHCRRSGSGGDEFASIAPKPDV